MSSVSRHRGEHATKAVVLGAGVGGLAAAQLLSQSFDSVQVLERDSSLPEQVSIQDVLEVGMECAVRGH